MIQIGDRVRDYEVLASLRAGGMATLFLGRRVGAAGFARPVAIKIVHPHLATDDAFIEMFVDEAKLSARINHPNVVHVEELGQVDGTYFLVMEYVHGCSLGALLRALARRGRALSPELAVHIAIKLCEGLHAAHESRGPTGELLGVVHRDVNPANTLLSYSGHVKLIDFGVAKAANRSQETTSASLKGKVAYMSPEQAYGRADVDRRTDVYALGVVLWEMLATKRLFGGGGRAQLEILERVRHPHVVEPSRLNPEVSAALDAAVMSALRPRREDRPASAMELRRKLVEAMPTAAGLEASQLSELLGAVMHDQILEELEAMPESVRGELIPDVILPEPDARDPDRAIDEAIEPLTVSGTRLNADEPLADIDIAVDAIHQETTSPLAPVPAPRARRLLIAGALMVVAAIVVGGWWGYRRGQSEPPTPTAGVAPVEVAPEPPPTAAPPAALPPEEAPIPPPPLEPEVVAPDPGTSEPPRRRTHPRRRRGRSLGLADDFDL